VNRALRKASDIGIRWVEEIRSLTASQPTRRESKTEIEKIPAQPANGSGDNGNGSRVRDRLCQLIRQHQLDTNLVKSYATDFCGPPRPCAMPQANASRAPLTLLMRSPRWAL